MLLRTVIFASIAMVLATQVPRFLHQDMLPPATPSHPPQTAPVIPAAIPAAGGRVQLSADGRGHFSGAFRINGKPIDGLVDTGASLVAINESTARRLGYGAGDLDFRYKVDTANGTTDAAKVVLDRVEIGGLRVRDVDAMVLRDRALSGTLVGMSFLRKLRSYSVDDGRMTLVP